MYTRVVLHTHALQRWNIKGWTVPVTLHKPGYYNCSGSIQPWVSNGTPHCAYWENTITSQLCDPVAGTRTCSHSSSLFLNLQFLLSWLSTALWETMSHSIALDCHGAQQLWNWGLDVTPWASLQGRVSSICTPQRHHHWEDCGYRHSDQGLKVFMASPFRWTCPNRIYCQRFCKIAWREVNYPFPGHCLHSLFHTDLLHKTPLNCSWISSQSLVVTHLMYHHQRTKRNVEWWLL